MKQFLFVTFFLLFLAACEADPTLVPSTPQVAPTDSLQTIEPSPAQTTVSEIQTRAPSATPVPTRTAATRRPPSGSIVVAGVGAPSREITALPEFVSRAVYDSLLRVNPRTGDLVPGLAEQWLVSEDAKTFVFILRDNVKWHDGAPLTAEDVAFTLRALSAADIRIHPAADFGPLQAITATDARTVSITFREAYCAALTYIGTVPILPKHLLENKSLANLADAELIGTGPLLLRAWHADTITFVRNPNYWNGAPQIVNWTYRAFPNENAAQDAVRQQRADIVVTKNPLTEIPNLPIAANEFYALALNTKRAPFDDPRVRQAIAAALSPDEFTQTLDGTRIQTSLLDSFWAHPNNLAPIPFDAMRARQLFSEAGWRDTDGDGVLDKDGKPFEVTLWARAEEPRSELGAQLARRQLAKVGVRAVLKLTDRILFLTRAFLQEYDMALVPFNIPLDPDQHYFWASSETEPGFGLNVTGYANVRVDEALNAGNRVARCEPTARKNAYAPVFQQLAQDVPMVFLFAPNRFVTTPQGVQGIAPSSFAGDFWNLNTWEVAP